MVGRVGQCRIWSAGWRALEQRLRALGCVIERSLRHEANGNFVDRAFGRPGRIRAWEGAALDPFAHATGGGPGSGGDDSRRELAPPYASATLSPTRAPVP